MNNRVSIVIPTRDRPRFLREAVQSVLGQTVAAHEIIIVDDGSRTDCQTFIKDIASSGARTSLYRFEKSRGVSAARNLGLGKATGDYVVLLDDDDLLHSQMIEAGLECFERQPKAQVVVCRSYLFSRSPKHEPLLPAFNDYQNMERNPFSEILLRGVTLHSCMVRRDALREVRFSEDLGFGEDTYFWLCLASRGCRFKFSRDACVFVRRHGENASSNPEYTQGEEEYLLRLLRSGMLRKPEDEMVVRWRLMTRMIKAGNPKSLEHLAYLLKCPRTTMRYLRVYISLRKRSKEVVRLFKQHHPNGIERMEKR